MSYCNYIIADNCYTKLCDIDHDHNHIEITDDTKYINEHVSIVF